MALSTISLSRLLEPQFGGEITHLQAKNVPIKDIWQNW